MFARALPIALLTAFAPFAAAQSGDRLDEILSEVNALRSQVAQLEQRVAELEQMQAPSPAEVAAAMTEAKTYTASSVTAEQAEPKERWIDKMRIELIKAEARASGPWTEAGVWDRIHEGMTEEEARAILGEPTKEKFSVRKDTDLILVYEGDLNGDGKLIEGEVRIHKGKVSRFEPPVFQ